MGEKYEKIINNMYNLINKFYRNLKISNNNEIKIYDDFKQENTDLEQVLLEYNASIYKNIEQKQLLFEQILDVREESAYTLTEIETEILRQYIGIYNDGEGRNLETIAKIFNKSSEKIKEVLEQALLEMLNPFFQEQVLTERNEIIKEASQNKFMKQQLLEQDINFLIMTDNLEEIFKLMNINTIKDLLNIDAKTIQYLNIQYGYNTNFKVFPKRIIKQIHELGLEFKNEELIKKLHRAYIKLDEIPLEKIDIEVPVLHMETVYDLVCAQQFEPELLDTLDLNEKLYVDRMISGNYRQREYLKLIDEIREEQTKAHKDIRVVKNIKGLVEKEYPYLDDVEIDLIEKDINNIFEIKNDYTEDEKRFLKTYFSEKN